MFVPLELKIKYLSRRLEELERLKSHLEQDDYSLALKMGHQVKGNALTFEIPEIATIGSELEHAAKIKDKLRVQRLMMKMEQTIVQVQSHF